MSEQEKITLERYKEKLGAKVPQFAQALRDEEASLHFCRKTRADLRKLREDMGMKQSQIAEKLQMSQPAVSKIEKGEGDIGLLTLARYASALGMQPTVSFAPTTATYLEHDSMKVAVRAMEKLTESRSLHLHEAAEERMQRAMLMFDTSAKIPNIPGSLFAAVLANILGGVINQSLSTEIAKALSAFSDLEVEDVTPSDKGRSKTRVSHGSAS